MVVPALKNPRMGVASHLQGMTNGPFLIVAGLLWPHLALTHVWQVVAVALLTYGTYANWLATQLAAIWGAGQKFAPGAAGGHVASAAKEGIVNVLLVSLAPAIIAATIILLAGVLR
jgi:(hydroxyamino)benzene mutase